MSPRSEPLTDVAVGVAVGGTDVVVADGVELAVAVGVLVDVAVAVVVVSGVSLGATV
jgi:hypothetical protein